MAPRLRAWAALALVASLGGCASPEVERIITRTLAIPVGGAVSDVAVMVPRGRAIAFVAQPMNGDETLKEDIDLRPMDPTICSVWDLQEKNQFVVVGLEEGVTDLEIIDEAGLPAPVLLRVQVTP